MELYIDWQNVSASERADLLATRPGVDPPDGIVPNFANPPTRNDIGISIVTLFFLLVVVTGSLRLYARVFVVRVLKLEDCLGFAAYVCPHSIPYIGLNVVLIHIIRTIGFLVDGWNIPLGSSLQWSMYLWIFRLIYALVMLFAKTAILLEWKNLFVPKGTRNWFFWATMTMLVINIITYSVAIILTCLRCKPVWKRWEPWVDGYCSDQKSTDVATTFINLALDVVILLLPQPIIWKLNMTWQRRIGVSLIFSVGLFVVTCAIGRVHTNLVLDYYGNTTRDGAVNLIWGYGEATFVMVVFAAPGIPKAFSKHSFLGGVVTTLRSWIRLDDGTRDNSDGSNDAKGHHWVQTIGGSGGKERKPTETELDLMETRNDDGSEAGFNHTHAEEVKDRTLGKNIWKTTIFEAREDPASKTTTDQIVGRQHPWVNSNKG
ncbi:hypothetical protein NUW58_g174 [Xylaria curta]|uniref:Uncharacterized protein n=1 Tax=Xylaria curta TaxID=42375 RepID=A0ACC1PRZ8_9PEZI|nr:hypothetical protein NUW58_g174 [Xylaria curta]